MERLPGTDLEVFPLCLGGNVFGWTADEEESFAVLDAYAAAGGNFIDTADNYSAWVDGHQGGESEAVIGRWMAARGNRAAMVVATKVGMVNGLAPEVVTRSALASRDRLGVETIDVLYAHRDDPDVALEDSLGAFDELVNQGVARYFALSNYSAARLTEVLAVCDREGFVRPVALQPEYNLVARDFELELQGICALEEIAVLPYYGLATGFLTGKYRPGAPGMDGPRSARPRALLEKVGVGILDALTQVAAGRGVSSGAIALAWLRAQATVVAPLASARTTEQLADLLPMAGLELTDEELAALDAAAPAPA